MQELEKFLSGLAGRKGTAAADPDVSGSDSRFRFVIPDSRFQISGNTHCDAWLLRSLDMPAPLTSPAKGVRPMRI